jgi:RNA polymerase sigma-70 factor (ECF subfamily)
MSANQETVIKEVCQELQGKLHAAAYSILLSHDEAMDVVQEAFLKAWIEDRFFEEGFHRKAWLYTVVRNLSLSRRRAVGRLYQWMKKQWIPVETQDPQVVEQLIKKQSFQELEMHIRELSLKERDILALHYIAGYSCSEIEKLTGLAKGTVTSCLARARKKLETKLSTSEQKHGK